MESVGIHQPEITMVISKHNHKYPYYGIGKSYMQV